MHNGVVIALNVKCLGLADAALHHDVKSAAIVDWKDRSMNAIQEQITRLQQ
jgi:hypothetical protein